MCITRRRVGVERAVVAGLNESLESIRCCHTWVRCAGYDKGNPQQIMRVKMAPSKNRFRVLLRVLCRGINKSEGGRVLNSLSASDGIQ